MSLLPLPGKLLEKIMHSRMMEFLDHNNLLDKQGGFRPGHSTIDTMLYFINDLFSAINNNQITFAIFIDFKKAFDTVDHKILLRKLDKLELKNISGFKTTYSIDLRKHLQIIYYRMRL